MTSHDYNACTATHTMTHYKCKKIPPHFNVSVVCVLKVLIRETVQNVFN